MKIHETRDNLDSKHLDVTPAAAVSFGILLTEQGDVDGEAPPEWWTPTLLDRKVQLESARSYRNALRCLEIRQSTGRTGSCLDGAAAESFFGTIKAEIGRDSWPDRATARRDIENWIADYNQRRLRSTLGYETPTATRISWQEGRVPRNGVADHERARDRCSLFDESAGNAAGDAAG